MKKYNTYWFWTSYRLGAIYLYLPAKSRVFNLHISPRLQVKASVYSLKT